MTTSWATRQATLARVDAEPPLAHLGPCNAHDHALNAILGML